MAVNDIVELNILIDALGERYENVLGFRFATVGASMAGLASDFNTNLLTQWLVQDSVNASCAELDVESVFPNSLATVSFSVSPAKVGPATGDMLPPQDAIVISWRTDLKGRSYRGRSFIGPLAESVQNNGVIVAGAVTNMNNIISAMLTRYGPTGTSADYRFGIISRRNNGAVRPAPIITQVTGGIADIVIRSQRRRQIGKGQ